MDIHLDASVPGVALRTVTQWPELLLMSGGDSPSEMRGFLVRSMHLAATSAASANLRIC